MQMTITVKDLIGRGRVVAGTAGIKREVTSPQISRPELAQWSTYRDMGGSMLHLTPAQASHLCTLPEKGADAVGPGDHEEEACRHHA